MAHERQHNCSATRSQIRYQSAEDVRRKMGASLEHRYRDDVEGVKAQYNGAVYQHGCIKCSQYLGTDI